MSKADGVCDARRTDKPTVATNTVRARTERSLYDSEQVPVLIRLPDLKSAAPSPVASPKTSAESAHPPDGATHAEPVTDVAAQERQSAAAGELDCRRRRAADRDTTVRRYTVRGILAALPSQALVVLVLAAVTALVYLLVQGTPRAAGPEETTDAAGVASSDAPDAAPAAKEPKLWPAGPGRDDPAAAPTFSAAPELAAHPELPQSRQELPAPAAASSEFTGADRQGVEPVASLEAPFSAGPADAPAVSVGGWPPEPVQGWPAESGAPVEGQGAADTNTPGTAGPALERAGWGAAPYRQGASAYGSLPPADSMPGAVPPTGGSAGVVAETATLDGTIDFPQPRVDYERPRSSIH